MRQTDLGSTVGAAEASRDVVIRVTRDGEIAAWSADAESMFGHTASEVLGRHLDSIVPPSRWPAEEEALARTAHGVPVEPFDSERQTRDGRRLQVSVTMSPLHDASSAIVGASITVRDMSAVRRSELANELLGAIVQSSDDAIVSKTLDGIITSWNPAAERMFGHSAVEAIGRHITLIIPPERFAEEDDVIARVRRGEKVDHFETERVAKDGHRLDISLTVSPVRDKTGRVVGASKVARDISDRKRADAERESLLALAERSRVEAEHANTVKDEFLAVLSHELRAPLSAMLGWLRILQRAADHDPALVHRAVETLERNISIQTGVINDLLDVSRIISGKLQLDRQRVDLVRVVSDGVESFRPTAEGKGVTLRLHATPRAAEITGDPARLQQVIANLLGNAIKFTDAGGTITVGLDDVGDGVRLVVQDTGIGVAPEFLPHIFERFRQADSSTTRRHGGLGLGLSIVKHIVEQHGGSIVAESAGEGLGTRFSVTLPAIDPGSSPSSEHVAEVTRAPGDLGGLEVLVVEDDPDAREALGLVLTAHGCRVRGAASVAEALEAFDRHAPQIIVSDIGLPEEDGYVLIRAVREREERRDTPRTLCIAVTGFAGRVDFEMALRAGFDDHVGKPIDPKQLLDRLRSHRVPSPLDRR